MVLLQRQHDLAHHPDRLILRRLLHLHHLEAAGQRRVLFDMAPVFRPGSGRDRAQCAAGERRLQQVGRVPGASGTARPDQRMRLVNEQDDRPRRRLHLLDDLAQPVLEFALHAGAGL